MNQQTDSLPAYTDFFQPVLDALKDLGGSGRPAEVRNWIAEKLRLTDSQLEQSLASGESAFSNRVQWARFYLVKSGYLDSSKRGVWALTEKGAKAHIDLSKQKQIEREVKQLAATREKAPEAGSDIAVSPDAELFDSGVSHRPGLLSLLKKLPPTGFERLCQRLLRESGFEEVTVTAKSSDGGIDGHGILQLNAFVSFTIMFQCKRYKDVVGSPVIRDFRGAMMGRADKGLVLTTGTFTSDAKREAIRDGVPPIELVDGEDLLDLFESLELGLRPKKAFDIDDGFFDEFRQD